MLKGSAAVLTHWAGGENRQKCPSHQLATVAAWGPAGANDPFRKENPPAGMKPQGLVSKVDHTFAFQVIWKGVSEGPRAQDISVDNNGELGEDREKGESGNGVEFWDLENPTMAKEEDITEG